ncbi:hypothetical protein BC938DRAFT_473597 [Jimgerdemannia flammicorona]|uniref:Uncharacterized protein n=1 Tax=Jimgerdemannia flammicorona TaxID=994334 RepID=A0A433QTB2_9FUNG|nr:hypothetical protein BC938DRAFT_473597 [Jimgerdemannia flammicorona]
MATCLRKQTPSLVSSPPPFLFSGRSLPPNRLLRNHGDHLVAQHGALREPIAKEPSGGLEPLAVPLHIAQFDALGPPARGRHELHVADADLTVVQRRLQGLLEEVWTTEEVLGDTHP